MNTLVDFGSRRSGRSDRRRGRHLEAAGGVAISVIAGLVVLPIIAVDETIRALWPTKAERRIHSHEETPLGVYYD